MPIKSLFLIEGSDLESTKRDVLKIVDPEGASMSGEGEIKLSKADNIARLQIDLDHDNMHFMIPMEIFEGLNIEFNHPAAASLKNGIIVNNKTYVLVDDNVAQLPAQQCRPTT
jgi:hypothetical protein